MAVLQLLLRFLATYCVRLCWDRSWSVVHHHFAMAQIRRTEIQISSSRLLSFPLVPFRSMQFPPLIHLIVHAGVFLSFGLSGVIPAVHYSVQEGWIKALNQASLGWLILMGLLYIIGTMFYALRIPERFFPGKFDIWVRFNKYLLNPYIF